jgi:hypothetical protein
MFRASDADSAIVQLGGWQVGMLICYDLEFPAIYRDVYMPSRKAFDAGDTATISVPRAVLAALFDRLGCYEQAATVAGFAFDPPIAAWVQKIPDVIAHLRDVLGDQTYESLVRKGETMSTAEIVTFAYDQIDQARTKLNAVSK